jgi:K+-transporting ATPase KdpF subunit
VSALGLVFADQTTDNYIALAIAVALLVLLVLVLIYPERF